MYIIEVGIGSLIPRPFSSFSMLHAETHASVEKIREPGDEARHWFLTLDLSERCMFALVWQLCLTVSSIYTFNKH